MIAAGLEIEVSTGNVPDEHILLDLPHKEATENASQ
jgi:hypothetical protein